MRAPLLASWLATWLATGLALAVPASAAQWQASEQALLVPGAALAGDDIGRSVATGLPWTAVGAPLDDTLDDEAGAVHVWHRQAGGSWSFDATLHAPAAERGERFGTSVALAAGLLVVGAPYADQVGLDAGSAHVFRRAGSSWVHEAELLAPDADPGDTFGSAVGTDGGRLLIGAPHTDENGLADIGSVYVYAQGSGGGWQLEQRLTTSIQELGMEFGAAVDIDGGALIGGARFLVSCYVFEHFQGAWFETAVVSSPTELHSGGIGKNCAIQGDTVVIGAPSDDLVNPLVPDGGSAYVWVRGSTGWTMQQKLKSETAAAGEFFGRSVDVEGDTIVIGANKSDTSATGGAPSSGAGYVFRRSGTIWTQTARFHPAGVSTGDEFGRSVDLASGLAVLGAPLAGGSGSAHAFAIHSPAEAYCTAGSSTSGCQAQLSAQGLASATAPSGFVVTASGVESQKGGLFFFGSSGRQANSWGNGTSFQCVMPPVRRGGVLSSGGSSIGCGGTLSQDLNALWCSSCPKPLKNPGPGTLVQVQAWYRDPGSTSNQTTSLSDALEFGVGP